MLYICWPSFCQLGIIKELLNEVEILELEMVVDIIGIVGVLPDYFVFGYLL